MNTCDRIKQKFEQMSEEEKIEFFERQNEKSQTDQKYRNAVLSKKGMDSAKYLCGQTDSSDEELRSFKDMANAGNIMAMYDIASVYYQCHEYYKEVEDNSKKAFHALVMANLWVEEVQTSDPEYMEMQREKEQQKIKELKVVRERIAKYQGCISAHYRSTVGLKVNGTVVAFGENSSKQCNTENWKNIVAVSTGGWHTVGLKADGTVVAVGSISGGRCNTGSWKNIVAISASIHTIGLKADGTVIAADSNNNGRSNIGNWRDIIAISAGQNHTVGLKADGTVVAVGDNEKEQCETGSWKNIVAISAGEFHTVGLQADGTVVVTDFDEKMKTLSWRDIVAIFAGDQFGTVGLKADGTVIETVTESWAHDDAIFASHLGGDSSSRSSTASDVTRKIGNWRDIVAISVGQAHVVGLKANGSVVSVGRSYGEEFAKMTWNDIGPVPEELLLKWKQRREQGKCQNCEGILSSGGKCKSCDPGGCYVATCVYGSYDCPEVWTLRRYRDNSLNRSWFGKRFVQVYYTVSPKIVKVFGKQRWFNLIGKSVVDMLVKKLQNNGVDNSPYSDY